MALVTMQDFADKSGAVEHLETAPTSERGRVLRATVEKVVTYRAGEIKSAGADEI